MITLCEILRLTVFPFFQQRLSSFPPLYRSTSVLTEIWTVLEEQVTGGCVDVIHSCCLNNQDILCGDASGYKITICEECVLWFFFISNISTDLQQWCTFVSNHMRLPCNVDSIISALNYKIRNANESSPSPLPLFTTIIHHHHHHSITTIIHHHHHRSPSPPSFTTIASPPLFITTIHHHHHSITTIIHHHHHSITTIASPSQHHHHYHHHYSSPPSPSFTTTITALPPLV